MSEIVKITGGMYRGRKIQTPGEGTHPMGAREKLALFNMIGSYLPGAVILDAYAGSGALGVEALSRGAEFVLFVDSDKKAVKTIMKNIRELGMSEHNGMALEAKLPNLTEHNSHMIDTVLKLREVGRGGFDVVLADPPYDKYEPRMVTALAPMVAEGGILVASTPCEGPEITGLEKIRTRKYAAAYITIYRKCLVA